MVLMADAMTTESPRRRRSRAGRIALFVVLGIVVLLIVLVVVAEFVLRQVVNREVAAKVEASLPAGTTGHVEAHAHGLIIPQLLAGSLDDVDLTSPKLTVQGIPLGVNVTAHGIPLSGEGTVNAVEGSVSLAGSSVHSLAKFNALFGKLSLRNGGVTLAGSTSVLGFTIDYAAEGTVAAQSSGTGITITPQKVSVTNSALGFDLNNIPGVTKTPVSVCTSQFLPASVRVRSLDITSAKATVRVTASNLPLSQSALKKTGTCS
jgi:hypothetical protein